MSKRRPPPIYVPESWENPAYLNAKILSRTILSDFRNIDKIREYTDKRECIDLPKESLLTETPTRIVVDDMEPPIAYAACHLKEGENSHFFVAISALLIKKGATVSKEAGTRAIHMAELFGVHSLEELLKLHGARTAGQITKEKNPIVINADQAKIHENNGKYAEAAALYLKNADYSIKGANELYEEHRAFFNRQFFDENGNQRPECTYTKDCSDLIRNGILEYTIEHHLNPLIEAIANVHDESRTQLMQSTITTIAKIPDDKLHTKVTKAVIAKMQTIAGMDNEITAMRNSLKKLAPPAAVASNDDVHILNQTFSPTNHKPFASDGLRRRHAAGAEKVIIPSQRAY